MKQKRVKQKVAATKKKVKLVECKRSSKDQMAR